MNQTTVIAVGTLITPARLRHLADGTPVTNFRIACNERRFDREANAWIDRDTFYVTVSCWRRLAEHVCSSLTSGDPVIVRGRIFTRSYDSDGRRNSVTEMEADVVAPDLTRCTAAVSRTKRLSPQVADAAAQEGVPSEGPWPGGGTERVAVGDRQMAEAVPAAGH